MEEVLEAVESVLPAIEVVGCRFEGGFDGLGALRLVSDATAHTAFVSGECLQTEWREHGLEVSQSRDVSKRSKDFGRDGGQRAGRAAFRAAVDGEPPVEVGREHRGGGGNHHGNLHGDYVP